MRASGNHEDNRPGTGVRSSHRAQGPDDEVIGDDAISGEESPVSDGGHITD